MSTALNPREHINRLESFIEENGLWIPDRHNAHLVTARLSTLATLSELAAAQSFDLLANRYRNGASTALKVSIWQQDPHAYAGAIGYHNTEAAAYIKTVGETYSAQALCEIIGTTCLVDALEA